MPLKHHPSQQARADWVAANLPPGLALATAVHLEFCPTCAFRVQAMNGLLDVPPGSGADEAIPAPLQGVRLGDRRRLTRGVQAAPAAGVSGLGEAVWIADFKPGARLRLPRGPVGALVVIAGRLESSAGELTVGDFLELEAEPLDWVRATPAESARLVLVTDGEWPGGSMFAPLLRPRRRSGRG